jgi:hypothetical protein
VGHAPHVEGRNHEPDARLHKIPGWAAGGGTGRQAEREQGANRQESCVPRQERAHRQGLGHRGERPAQHASKDKRKQPCAHQCDPDDEPLRLRNLRGGVEEGVERLEVYLGAGIGADGGLFVGVKVL